MGNQVANTPNNAEKYLDKALQKSKTLARRYYENHSNTFIDEEDLAQEAMIAYLEGRSMGFGMIDAYRKAAPLTRTQMGKQPTPIFWQVFERTLIDEDAEDKMNYAVLQRQLREAIAKMEPINQDVIDRYFLKEESCRQIGEHYNKSRTWARNLVQDSIRRLRKELT
jgi:DNA-directed RNA polymerase specialized sigma24 family protein